MKQRENVNKCVKAKYAPKSKNLKPEKFLSPLKSILPSGKSTSICPTLMEIIHL